jgi:hypothetical protein
MDKHLRKDQSGGTWETRQLEGVAEHVYWGVHNTPDIPRRSSPGVFIGDPETRQAETGFPPKNVEGPVQWIAGQV